MSHSLRIRLTSGLGLLLALVLLLAALGKIMNWSDYMSNFPALDFLGSDSRIILAIMLVTAELVFGFELLCQPASPRASLLALPLFLTFLVFAVSRLIPGVDQTLGVQKGCGCHLLSSLEPESKTQYFYLVRNGLLFAFSTGHFWGAKKLGSGVA
jgi:uncharacterized membrane protein YphA (DoxX/SURF4 family)